MSPSFVVRSPVTPAVKESRLGQGEDLLLCIHRLVTLRGAVVDVGLDSADSGIVDARDHILRDRERVEQVPPLANESDRRRCVQPRETRVVVDEVDGVVDDIGRASSAIVETPGSGKVCSSWRLAGAYSSSNTLAISTPPMRVSCSDWCSVLYGVQLSWPPPMKRCVVSGVLMSAASAYGFAGPNGLSTQLPSAF